MERPASRPKRDRPIFVDILLIGAVMAALMYGGLRLLADTHDAWDAREARKVQRAAPPPMTAEQVANRQRANRQLEAIRAERAQEERDADQARLKNRRCVGGVLFAELDGVLTNVGRC